MKKHPFWLFILLPATTMLLGWGLRGFIGGGPFGAMIPGAMVMMTICLLLRVPASTAAVMTVFATAGIGMGGEMTYGQTLGFLRNPTTVWWGTCGTTVKGGVWGLVGGTFIGLGLIYRNVPIKTIIIGLLLFLIAFVVGLKLINDPKLIYFSDPINKPRQESWAGLLFAGTALLGWLKLKATRNESRLVFRFAKYGLIGGALGFGLGAFWIVIGSLVIKHSWITDWWKLMEFSFGFIMGGVFGYAAWLSRNEIEANANDVTDDSSFIKLIIIVAIAGVMIYFLLPLIAPFVDAATSIDTMAITISRTIARVLVNYTFMGSLLIMIALRWPYAAFQLAVTLTFCHTVIDLVEDMVSKNIDAFPSLVGGAIVLIASGFLAYLVAVFQLKKLPSEINVFVARLVNGGGGNHQDDFIFSIR